MIRRLQPLPIGVQTFKTIREDDLLYVDKTARLEELVTDYRRVFLSRPRRFGKSLTLSTLDAMFSGKVELFKGLAAEAWVMEQAKHPAPVLRLDMSTMAVRDVAQFERSLDSALTWRAEDAGVTLSSQQSDDKFQELIRALYKQGGPVVVLIDEYDKPILDKIGDLPAAEAMREALRALYTVLKGCDEYLRFVMLTGISKFSKLGVFSAMNNLKDISMAEQFGDLAGYTQEELERDFADWIDDAAARRGLTRGALLTRVKDYYDGFCFDGVTRLYNPFSTLNFLADGDFRNYWYDSGSPTFIIRYMEQHGIKNPEEYRHLEVDLDFMSAREIERAKPESFMCQAGYLTIEKKRDRTLTLDYPNREVLESISRLYLDGVYRVSRYVTLGNGLWEALRLGDVEEALNLYNTALSGLPYEDIARRDEFFYRSLFLMLLRGAGVEAYGEVHNHRGRSDVLITMKDRAVVLEFKLAKTAGEVEACREAARSQIAERGYARPFDDAGRAVTAAAVVVDEEQRMAVL